MRLVKTLIDTHVDQYGIRQEKTFQFEMWNLSLSTQDFFPKIETMIARNKPISQILRLLALQNLTLPQDQRDASKELLHIQSEILNNYGVQHLLTLEALKKAGILAIDCPRKESKYSKIKDRLQLLDVTQTKKDLVSRFYSRYCPLTARLIQKILQRGDLTQIGKELKEKIHFDNKFSWPEMKKRPSVLVYFIGGITFAEVSILRFLAKTYNFEIQIACTNLVNHRKFLEPFIQK